jgi:dUTP pyrophosphatase
VATSTKTEYHYVEFGTGLAFEIPEGHVGLLFPRSSVTDKGIFLGNSVGVIDSNYRGEVKFRFYISDKYLHGMYQPGDRIGQLIVMPYPTIEIEETNTLSDTNRGEQGYGSSGS